MYELDPYSLKSHWIHWIAVLVYNTLHDLLPAYLAEDCQLVSVTGRRQLHSSDIDTCLAQRTSTRLGDRSVAGPCIWNILPTQLRESDITPGQFRRALKSIYLVTDSCVRALCTNLLTYYVQL